MSGPVAVCVVGFRNVADVIACARSLAADSEQGLELIVCENGGAEAARAVEAALHSAALPFSATVLPPAGNVGYAAGLNRCVSSRPEADGWWILNPDATVDADALAALRERAAVGDCEMIGSTILGADGRVQTVGGRWRPWLGRVESIGKGLSADALPSREAVEARLDFVSGASLYLTPTGRRLAGPLREDYFLYAEEVEWCVRAVRAGARLGWAPSAVVRHGQGGTTGSGMAERTRPRLPIELDERNKLLVVRDTKPWALVTAVPASLALLTARYAARGAWRQWCWALQGWIAALANRRGPPRSTN